MKHRLAFFLAASLLFPSSPALALGIRTVFASEAMGANGSIISLKVYPGYGLNLNFIPTGEVIKKAWIDDPGRIALSFDGCLSSHSGQNCTSSGATVVHLRQIKPINFPHLPSSPSGGTLLTLIAEGTNGRKLYQFRILPASGEPEYTALTIIPDSERPQPLLPTRPLHPLPAPVLGKDGANGKVESPFPSATVPVSPSVSSSSSRPSLPPPSIALNASDQKRGESLEAPTEEVVTAEETAEEEDSKLIASGERLSLSPSPDESQQDPIRIANDVAYGLLIASHKGQINYGTRMYRRVNSAIRWLRRSQSLSEAARQSKVPLETLEQLVKWGQSRP